MSSVIAKLSQELSNSMTLEAVKGEIEAWREYGLNDSRLQGGSAGNAGTNSGVHEGGGGGGGWGASGGSGNRGDFGGSGGAAISGVSRTLSNSGTIYGST